MTKSIVGVWHFSLVRRWMWIIRWVSFTKTSWLDIFS